MAYRNPTPTVDIIIAKNDEIVLVKRKNPPLGWALPGGFVDYGESIEAAAEREAKEETGLDIVLCDLLGVYSDPTRDPRQHTMSTTFIAKADGIPVGADDAAEAKYFSLQSLPDNIVFDHRTMIEDFVHFRSHHTTRQIERYLAQKLTRQS